MRENIMGIGAQAKRAVSVLIACLMISCVCCGSLVTSAAEYPSGVETRAVSVPTEYAPHNFYECYHEWTAKYYTWCSYILDFNLSRTLDVTADQPFSVEFYYEDGTYIDQVSSSWRNGKYRLSYEVAVTSAHDGYYFRIINEDPTGASILSGAEYVAY